MQQGWALLGLVGLLSSCAAAPAASPQPPPPAPVTAPQAGTPSLDSAAPGTSDPSVQAPAEPEAAPSEPAARDEFRARPRVDPAGPKAQNSLRGNSIGFPAISPPNDASPARELRLHFLDVGQGDSTLVECPGGEFILVDGGSGIQSSSKPARARAHLLRALTEQPKVDTVIVSHPDRDHYNALPYLLDGVAVGNVHVVGPADEYSGSFVGWLAGIPNENKARITDDHHDPKDSPSVEIPCGGATIHVLSVAAREAGDRSPKNSLSMVLLVSYEDFDAILTADATTVTEKRILGRYPHWWLDVELLKLGHHGSSTTSTSADWARATAPEVVVVSSGFENSHGHPRRFVVERTEATAERSSPHPFRWYHTQTQPEDVPAYAKAIYGTGSSGTIVVGSDGTSYWVEQEKSGTPSAVATGTGCCVTCSAGQPCGDSCIAATSTCSKPAGCACAAPQQ